MTTSTEGERWAMRKRTGRAWVRAAPICLALAACQEPEMTAVSGAGQEDCGDLGSCLQPLAAEVAEILAGEAERRGERLQVSFRPAYTEPSGVTIYCTALSRGLRNALNEEVGDVRDSSGLNFDAITAPRTRVTPPEVAAMWELDGDMLKLDVLVVLPEDREERASDKIPRAALSTEERRCLFSFAAGERWIEAGRDGRLRDEPTRRASAVVGEYERGTELHVQGYIEAADDPGDRWWVVEWQEDPESTNFYNLFTSDLADADIHDVGDVFRDCDYCPHVVVVPAGSFMMGSPPGEEGYPRHESPQHPVTIRADFAVGIHEVTYRDWSMCVNFGGDCLQEELFADIPYSGLLPSGHTEQRSMGRQDYPVGVSWDDAQSYVRWLSRHTGRKYGLLSESEWEYVARSGTMTAFHTGPTISPRQARYGLWQTDYGRIIDANSAAPVGSFVANNYGLHDVHGNAWEWVEDCWHENYVNAPSDGSAWRSENGGDCSVRVIRGGAYYTSPNSLRSASRAKLKRGYKIVDGFFLGEGETGRSVITLPDEHLSFRVRRSLDH